MHQRDDPTFAPAAVPDAPPIARLRQLRPATTGTSPVVAPVQLASPARQPRLQPPCQPPPASAEQRQSVTDQGLTQLTSHPRMPPTECKTERLVHTALRQWYYPA